MKERLEDAEEGTVVWTKDRNLQVPPLEKKKTGRPRKYPPLEALKRPQSLDQMGRQSPAWK